VSFNVKYDIVSKVGTRNMRLIRGQGAYTVRYSLNASGLIENPEALVAATFFIKPTLEAAKSFRPIPRVVGGKAVKVSNVKKYSNTALNRIDSEILF
jgi:hypothetical protein